MRTQSHATKWFPPFQLHFFKSAEDFFFFQNKNLGFQNAHDCVNLILAVANCNVVDGKFSGDVTLQSCKRICTSRKNTSFLFEFYLPLHIAIYVRGTAFVWKVPHWTLNDFHFRSPTHTPILLKHHSLSQLHRTSIGKFRGKKEKWKPYRWGNTGFPFWWIFQFKKSNAVARTKMSVWLLSWRLWG